MRERKWNGRLIILWSVVLLGMMSGMLFAMRAFARMQPPRVTTPGIAEAPLAESPAAAPPVVDSPPETGAAATERDYIDGDGSDHCPADYPIKANERSGIYHLPGDLAYDRTVPTYCYQSEASAERDGYRHAYR
jgi:hypothetical protein